MEKVSTLRIEEFLDSTKMKIVPKQKPYWKIRGWKFIEDEGTNWYYGYYRSKKSSMNGRIIEKTTLSSLSKKRILVYLKNPPSWLESHEKSRCMFEVGEEGWSRVHFHRNHPSTVGQAIMSVESFLNTEEPTDD